MTDKVPAGRAGTARAKEREREVKGWRRMEVGIVHRTPKKKEKKKQQFLP